MLANRIRAVTIAILPSAGLTGMPVLGIRVSSAHTLHRFNRAAETLDLIERSRLAPLGCGTLFPCQIKQYMDFGFKALFRYA